MVEYSISLPQFGRSRRRDFRGVHLTAHARDKIDYRRPQRRIRRSEIPQKHHVHLGQRRWLIEVRLIAKHCCSGVNEPTLQKTVYPTKFVGPREKILLPNVVLTVLCLSEEWPRMTSTYQGSADALCLKRAVAASGS
jgi:hypothetical protein